MTCQLRANLTDQSEANQLEEEITTQREIKLLYYPVYRTTSQGIFTMNRGLF